jgi:hypothetical protein
MKRSNLPRDLIEKLWQHGMGGKRLYVPKQPSQSLVIIHVPMVLEEIEATYEERGLTFYEESSPRKVFSGMFGKTRIAFKFNLKPRTATRVVSAAWRAWRDWFGHKERVHLQRLQQIAEGCGKEYTALFFSYLEIRGRLRKTQKVTANYYANYLSASSETVMQMIDLAKESIDSCSWRHSPQERG